jgi:hypothetical protein
MNIEAFLLCDCATQGEGKLNVLGAFDMMHCSQMPYVHPACAVVLKVRFQKIEEGDHPVRIQIIDQDGKNIGPKLEGTTSIQIPPGLDSAGSILILNIQGLRIEQYGTYRIDLAIDGNVQASLPLRVEEISKPA